MLYLKAIQQTNFNGNLNQPRNTAIFIIIEEAKETVLHFSQGTAKVQWMLPYDIATAPSIIYFALI